MKRLPAFLLVSNFAYVVFLPSLSGKIVSALGCLVAVALISGPRLSKRIANSVRTELAPSASSVSVAAMAVFALPALSFVTEPRVVFWRLDGRALLIVAWLIAASLLLTGARRRRQMPDTGAVSDPQPFPIVTLLFVVWTSLFWLMMVWDLGVGSMVVNNLRDDRLSLTFQIWETRRPSNHLFLAWYTQEAYARHEAYTNHLHPYLFFIYASSKLVQLATGLPPNVGRNVTPFVLAAVGAAAFAALLVRCPRISRTRGLKFYASVFFMLGFLISEGHYWTYLYTINFDSIFPLIVYLAAIVWACAQPSITDDNRSIVVASAAVFGAFGWIYTPVMIVALWSCFAQPGPTVAAMLARNRVLVRATLICALLGVVTYELPRVLIAVKGYTTSASPFSFRSGLDGDTRYFHDAVQAVLRPNSGNPRTWSDLLFPTFIPLICCLPFVIRDIDATRYGLLSQLGFMMTPYLFSLALFPQSVSIHPYLYDQLLFLPAALLGAIWSLTTPVQSRLHGLRLLLAGLLVTALIMGNFIEIAQTVRKALPG